MLLCYVLLGSVTNYLCFVMKCLFYVMNCYVKRNKTTPIKNLYTPIKNLIQNTMCVRIFFDPLTGIKFGNDSNL